MAIWEFKFSLIPIKRIEQVHGRIIPILEEYKPSNPERLLSLPIENDEMSGFTNYWEGIEIEDEILQAIKILLPQCESWSKDATMFGDQYNRIEIWDDNINCFLDLRYFSRKLLEGLLNIAKSLDCKIVLLESGEVIETEIEVVIEKIKESNAYAFCLEPKKFLETLEEKRQHLKN